MGFSFHGNESKKIQGGEIPVQKVYYNGKRGEREDRGIRNTRNFRNYGKYFK